MIYCFTYENTVTFAEVMQVTVAVPVRFCQHFRMWGGLGSQIHPDLQSIHIPSATLSLSFPKLVDNWNQM